MSVPLPVMVHGDVAGVPRSSHTELLRTDAVLRAADDALGVCMLALKENEDRAHTQTTAMEEMANACDEEVHGDGDRDREGGVATLTATLGAVAAATGTTELPPLATHATRREVTRWVVNAIGRMRETTIKQTMQHVATMPTGSMSSEDVRACMHLVHSLNGRLMTTGAQAMPPLPPQ